MRDRTRCGFIPVLAILGSLAGCQNEPSERMVADLLSPANAPQLVSEADEMLATSSAFGAGFHPVENADTEPYRWLGAEPAQLRFEFLHSGRRSIEIEGYAVGRPGMPPIRVEARLNGRELQPFEFDEHWRRVRVAIPDDLSVAGRQFLDLVPAAARRPCEVDAAAPDCRQLSVAIRAVRVVSAHGASKHRPSLEQGRLRLPPGSAASWILWVPERARLVAQFGRQSGPYRFAIERDGAPPRTGADLRAVSGHPVRLILTAGETRPVIVRKLHLEAPPRSSPAARAPGRGLLVVGVVSDGIVAHPCSTDPDRALCCLLTGDTAAAFGREEQAAVDLVTSDPTVAGQFLAATPPPVTVALVLSRDASAVAVADQLRRLIPDLFVIVASLPSGVDDIAVYTQIDGLTQAPVHAGDIDLVATLRHQVGQGRSQHQSGVDLEPYTSGRTTAPVREVALVHDVDRTFALTLGDAYLIERGDPGTDRSVRRAYVDRLARRQRRAYHWLAPVPGEADVF